WCSTPAPTSAPAARRRSTRASASCSRSGTRASTTTSRSSSARTDTRRTAAARRPSAEREREDPSLHALDEPGLGGVAGHNGGLLRAARESELERLAARPVEKDAPRRRGAQPVGPTVGEDHEVQAAVRQAAEIHECPADLGRARVEVV